MMQAEEKVLERDVIDGVTVLRLMVTDPGLETALWVLEDEFGGILESCAEGALSVVLNLASVENIPTTVLAKLLSFRTKVQAAGGRLCLCCVKPQIREIFKITRFDKLFSLYEHEAEAVAAMR